MAARDAIGSRTSLAVSRGITRCVGSFYYAENKLQILVLFTSLTLWTYYSLHCLPQQFLNTSTGFVCVEVLWPSQPNGVMSSVVNLPNHTFTGQHIFLPETDNCPSWISGRERMTVENISWSISTKECCWPRRRLNLRPPGLQSDGTSTGNKMDVFRFKDKFEKDLTLGMLGKFSADDILKYLSYFPKI